MKLATTGINITILYIQGTDILSIKSILLPSTTTEEWNSKPKKLEQKLVLWWHIFNPRPCWGRPKSAAEKPTRQNGIPASQPLPSGKFWGSCEPKLTVFPELHFELLGCARRSHPSFVPDFWLLHRRVALIAPTPRRFQWRCMSKVFPNLQNMTGNVAGKN